MLALTATSVDSNHVANVTSAIFIGACSGFEFGVPDKSSLVNTLLGMIVIFIMTSAIGATMGLRSESTSCCISRHVLKFWCAHRQGFHCRRYRQPKMIRQCSEDGCPASPAPLPRRRRRKSQPTSTAIEESAAAVAAAFDAASESTMEIRMASSPTPRRIQGRRSSLNQMAPKCLSPKIGRRSSYSFRRDSSNRIIGANNSFSAERVLSACSTASTTTRDSSSLHRVTQGCRGSDNNKLRSDILLDLARMQDWEELIGRCQSHPSEARQVDADGLLPLHWACSGGPPLSAVKALLSAYPAGAREVDMEGSTALHFICHYGVKCAAIVEVLHEHNSKAIRMRDAHGRTPLYHACDKGVSIDVLTLLLRYEPRAVTLPKYHGQRTPLSMIWRAALKAHKLPSLLSTRIETTSRSSSNKYLGKKWEKAMLLLQVASLGRVPDEKHISSTSSAAGGFKMLHASIAVPETPVDVFDAALELFPEQVMEQDKQGHLPLHLAFMTPSRLEPVTASVPPQINARRRTNVKQSGIGRVLQPWEQKQLHMTRALLERFPEAACTPNREGSLPISLALKSGNVVQNENGSHIGSKTNRNSSVVCCLLHANMDALMTKDCKSLMYPFMIAASAAGSSSPWSSAATAVSMNRTGNVAIDCAREVGRITRRLSAKRINLSPPWFSAPTGSSSLQTFLDDQPIDPNVDGKLFEGKQHQRRLVASNFVAVEPAIMSVETIEESLGICQLNTIFCLLRECPEAIRMR